MIKRLVLAAQVLGLLLPASFCHAYGAEGHKIVAMIAEDHLTSKTRAAVNELLAPETMPDVSSWADAYRVQHRETAPWHFADFEISDGKLEKASKGTVIEAITSQSAIVANTAADPGDRKQALKFVIHFVGDMHQPLHCADNHDSGGNGVKVEFLGHAGGNLHQVWDSGILHEMMSENHATSASTDLKDFARTIDNEHKALEPDSGNGTLMDWAMESHAAAKKYAYSYLKDDTLSSLTVTLDRSYYEAAKPVLRKMLALGGYRLAHTLNDIFDPPASSEKAATKP